MFLLVHFQCAAYLPYQSVSIIWMLSILVIYLFAMCLLHFSISVILSVFNFPYSYFCLVFAPSMLSAVTRHIFSLFHLFWCPFEHEWLRELCEFCIHISFYFPPAPLTFSTFTVHFSSLSHLLFHIAFPINRNLWGSSRRHFKRILFVSLLPFIMFSTFLHFTVSLFFVFVSVLFIMATWLENQGRSCSPFLYQYSTLK